MSTEETKLHIRLHVYDREIPVNVYREDEELYRKAAKLITETMNVYAGHFKGQKSDKDILYMSLIDIALRYERESSRNDVSPVNDILAKLTSEVETALGEGTKDKNENTI